MTTTAKTGKGRHCWAVVADGVVIMDGLTKRAAESTALSLNGWDGCDHKMEPIGEPMAEHEWVQCSRCCLLVRSQDCEVAA